MQKKAKKGAIWGDIFARGVVKILVLDALYDTQFALCQLCKMNIRCVLAILLLALAVEQLCAKKENRPNPARLANGLQATTPTAD